MIEGQSGECVEVLQGYLNLDNYGYRLAEDGVFGPDTRIAVLDYQGRNRLPADGNVGSITAAAILDRVEYVRRDIAENSVSSPVPMPRQPLDGGGDPGGAVALGRPAGECLREAVGLNNIAQETVEQDLKRQVDDLPDEARNVNKVRRVAGILGRASGALNGLMVVKCMMWDMPSR